MARKRTKVKDTQKYWEDRLRKEGLSMEAGTSRRVTYVGGSSTLDWVAGQQEMGTRDNTGDKSITYEQK